MAANETPTIRTDWRRLLRFARRLALFLVPAVLVTAAGVWWIDAHNRRRVCTRNLREKLAAFPDVGTGYRVLVVGDSRAEFSVDPRVLARELDVPPESCLNLAVAGGDPSGAAKALQTRPDLLRNEPVILLSVSISCLLDGAGHTSEDLLADCSLRERLDWLGPGRLASFYVDAVEQWIGLEKTRPTTRGISGFKPQPGALAAHTDEDRVGFLALLPWYADVRFDGVRARIVRHHLTWLASLEVPVLVFEAPLAPSWRAWLRGSPTEQADRDFTAAMQKLCMDAGLHWVSFRDRPGLTDGDFIDWLHTNEKGAAVFTGWLAEVVKSLRY